MQNIPPTPEFITEDINGALYLLPDGVLLTVGDVRLIDDATQTALRPTQRGRIHLRYGVAIAQPDPQMPMEALIPHTFVSERGAILTGAEMWNFMFDQFQIFPRADVIGLHSVSGANITKFMRDLDFGAPVRVFAYAAASDTIPAAEVIQVIAGDAAPDLPPYLARYRPERQP